MASMSAREIGVAAAAAAGVAEGAAALVDEGEDVDAVVPAEGGADEAGVAAGVTPAACFEPKIADTMLPKTLISLLLSLPFTHANSVLCFASLPGAVISQWVPSVFG